MLTNQSRLGQFRLIVLVLVTAVGCAAPARAKSKDDVVILKNGDRLTGGIKGLSRGELKFKASYMFKDLYWGFHLYENYDSKPPVRAEKSEPGASTSLGWKF